MTEVEIHMETEQKEVLKDPVCGMSVEPATAKHRAEYGGETYYFCSAGCHEKFIAGPGRFLGDDLHQREAVKP
jgi:Cu+-exporting ATPase